MSEKQYFDIHWISGGEMQELRKKKIQGLPTVASVDADGNVVFWPYPQLAPTNFSFAFTVDK